ncbi:MAG: tryptophan--tRNA ligase [Candidatus Wildermuthbacteria bacterium RIFCSPLOWO2_02_FULL_47_9c]|uniref:Tryptophan--tRNA ligase n=2 Tax=Candidatus Wildermuthiibacteriota TaxID=1817923 RepID=A0A1G2RUS2_9BACT|nr:MAG: tryptophan--tRNA ligase [Candidatus Wildermuthbacteria bacterium RIFCSPLOWO2_01_FULL_48_29]OHA76022.1 MAG: tryptophan--tRNA ligase [Candidatus Wildermuthbacteria bacterium RIFCSPLOWO2_02_FULL_47_9c]
MRILSGIQPTGQMHIGNYLGAVKQWTELQAQHECFFLVVDLHALTVEQNPREFAKATMEKVVELISVGLNPEKCVLFLQSHIKEHAELAWIFSTITPIAELERMTQYKDKAKKNKKNINTGLLTYPILMAADILLYQTQSVPVGKDQTQHLELTRVIARKFNKLYGNTFVEPETLVSKEGAKIMSLQDPKKKMSKSDGPQAYVSLFEEPASIRKKLMRAITDAGKEIVYNPSKKPGISNLLTIYSLFAEESLKDVEKQFRGKGYAGLKKSVADLLIDKLEPFRRKKKELLVRNLYLKEILKSGARKAQSVAEATMEDVRSKIGLVTP